MYKHPTSSPRLFGRRKGRPLRNRKSQLMAELLPQLEIPRLDEKASLDPVTLFPFKPRAIRLEIGFGGGEHLATQATRHSDIGFIGCEPFINGIASLLGHIDQEQIKNIRIYPDDARILIDALPDSVLDRCYVLFADPWPKARHARRRFIGPESLPWLARVMRPQAELHLATDDKGLADWMRESLRESRDFQKIQEATEPPKDWVPTRYEAKALKAGRQPVYMVYCRS